jgi:hypothetical protein
MWVALAALLAAVPATRPFPEERHLLDRRLETLRRILPDGGHPEVDMALVRQLAQEAGLTAVEIGARVPSEAGARGDVQLELASLGRFADVERFFRQVALSPRLIDVERLTLAGSAEGLVRLATVVKLPFRPLKAPLPAPPEGAQALTRGAPRPAAAAFVRDQALALAKADTIATLRRARRNPRLFLSELAAVVRERPVVVSHASLAEEFLIRGVAVGEGPVRALERRAERGFFRVAEFLVARSGGCHRFEIRGQTPVAGVDAELPLPTEDPFVQDADPCRVDRDETHGLTVKGPNAKTPGKGPLSLRLRDMDLADAFQVLHRLTAQGFLVDADVTGRVSLDLSRMSLDEILAAFEKQLGLRIAGGTLRRVSMARGSAGVPAAPATAPADGGPPVGFALKRADLRDVLAVMTDMDASLAVLGPPGSLGRASVWAKDVPLLALRSALLELAGLKERTEEGRRLLERSAGSEETLVPVAATAASERRLALKPQELSVSEFELAGLAARDDDWTALAYSPTGTLNAYRPGDRLADGTVRAIASTDALLDTEEGPLRVPIAYLR